MHNANTAPQGMTRKEARAAGLRATRSAIGSTMLHAMLAAKVRADEIHSPMVKTLLASLARALPR